MCSAQSTHKHKNDLFVVAAAKVLTPCRHGASLLKLCHGHPSGVHNAAWVFLHPPTLFIPVCALRCSFDDFGRIKKKFRGGADDRKAREAAALARLHGTVRARASHSQLGVSSEVLKGVFALSNTLRSSRPSVSAALARLHSTVCAQPALALVACMAAACGAPARKQAGLRLSAPSARVYAAT